MPLNEIDGGVGERRLDKRSLELLQETDGITYKWNGGQTMSGRHWFWGLLFSALFISVIKLEVRSSEMRWESSERAGNVQRNVAPIPTFPV